jgi:hypothetical protein
MARKSTLVYDKTLVKNFIAFIENHPPAQVSRRLRRLLMDYISSQLATGLPNDFHICLWDLYELFELLDHAGDQLANKKKDMGLQNKEL